MNRHQPYRQKPLQIPADHIRADTCDTRRFMNPHLGIWDEPATDPGYWHVSPNGEKAHLTTIVHCSLYIVHCQSYTFSAKEKDSETGLSYFGSRYYSSDLSIWLSVDPQAAKYPSLSPYAYCANNPVRVVDPDGEEIGDFYDQWGRKIGSDGQTDNNVFIVSDQNSQNKIKENKRNHGYTNAEDVNVDVATTYDVLNEVSDVYERTVKNGGYNEEASALPSNGGSTDWERKSGVNEHSVEVPLPQGDVLIHSHTLRKRNPRNPCDYASPKVISGADQTHFKNFKLNIVVGDDGGDCVGGVWSGRKATVSFYNSNSQNLLNLPLDVVKKIVNQ